MSWPPDDGRGIVVVEPHADDAFLSMGGHIAEWVRAGRTVTIVTVFSGTPKRGDEAKAYADAVGARWRGLGLIESGAGFDGEVAPVTSYRCPGAWVVGPLGLQHPEHRAVRDAVVADASYVEIPYGYKTKLADEVTSALAGRSLVSWLRPNGRKWRHVGLFRTQSTFFHFNPGPSLAPMAEVIVA